MTAVFAGGGLVKGAGRPGVGYPLLCGKLLVGGVDIGLGGQPYGLGACAGTVPNPCK